MRMASGMMPGLPARRHPPVYRPIDLGAVMSTTAPSGATPGPRLDQRADVEHYLEVADQLSGEALTPPTPSASLSK